MKLPPSARRLLVIVALAWLGSCADSPVDECTDCIPPAIWPGVVSDPVSGSTPLGGLAASSASDAVYISLAPGTIPGGEVASIRNRVTGTGVVAAMVAGGLDPVPVSASAGDTLDIAVRLAGSDSTLLFVYAVAAARRPIVVRTDPPPRKRDVPLNAVMLVVFSEPIDPATLTGATVQLVQGSTSVTGQLEFRDPANLTAAFVPAAPLAASTDYRLEVTQGIRDLDGEALEAPVTVEFTTASGLMPGASRIAFVRDLDPLTSTFTASDLYVMNPDGSQVTRLTFDGKAYAPAWSPDGTRIAFLSEDATGVRQIFVMEAEPARSSSRITDEMSSANVMDPVWSPDGTRIAFVKMERLCSGSGFCYDHYRVYVTGTTFGAAVTQLSSEPLMPDSVMVFHSRPEWSPDGSKIAFTSEVGRLDAESGNTIPDSALSGIYVMNSDGTGATRLAAGNWPAWSPDGARIAFSVHPGSHAWPVSGDCFQIDIHVVNADGSNLTRLTTGAKVTPWARLAWSPDGTQIAFPSMRDGASADCDWPYDTDVYVVNADGSGITRITNTGLDHSPVWSRPE